jgi:hypothetical protein
MSEIVEAHANPEITDALAKDLSETITKRRAGTLDRGVHPGGRLPPSLHKQMMANIERKMNRAASWWTEQLGRPQCGHRH